MKYQKRCQKCLKIESINMPKCRQCGASDFKDIFYSFKKLLTKDKFKTEDRYKKVDIDKKYTPEWALKL